MNKEREGERERREREGGRGVNNQLVHLRERET